MPSAAAEPAAAGDVYADFLAAEAPALHDAHTAHFAGRDELLCVPDAGAPYASCSSFDRAVSEACKCDISEAWLPLGGGKATRTLRVPSGHFALPQHLHHDLPWLGRPCPHTGERTDYGLVVRTLSTPPRAQSLHTC